MAGDVVGYLRDVNDGDNLYEVPEGRISIGRAEGSHIRLEDKSVSGVQAEIDINLASRPPKITLHDLGSRNGTFVNEVRVMGTSKGIKWGDVIRFGYDKKTYRLIKVEDLENFNASREEGEGPIPAHQRPPAGITSDLGHVVDREFADGSVVDRSFNSPLKDRPRHRSGSPSQQRAEFDGIGYRRQDPREAEERERARQEQEAQQRAEQQMAERERMEREREMEQNRPGTGHHRQTAPFDDPMGGRGHSPGRGGGMYAPGLPALEDGERRRDLAEMRMEEERRLADELEKKRRDLGYDDDAGDRDEEREMLVAQNAELGKQVEALVMELSVRTKKLESLQGDDLARCLLDSQETNAHMQQMLKAKEEETNRLRETLRHMSGAGGPEKLDTVLQNTSDKNRMLERENAEWKARDEKTARRWTELQDQSAAYAARVSELETLLGRQRDAGEEDAVARDTEVRAMNKRMAEIASAADPSKLEAAKFLVDQVSEQEKAMRAQKEHSMQLEARMLELKRENEFLRSTLNGLGADQGGDWQGQAVQRLRDQIDQLRAQGGVQAVLEAQDQGEKYYKALQEKDAQLAVFKQKELTKEAVQLHDRDSAALQEQIVAKNERIRVLEETNMKLENDKASMDVKLEKLQVCPCRAGCGGKAWVVVVGSPGATGSFSMCCCAVLACRALLVFLTLPRSDAVS